MTRPSPSSQLRRLVGELSITELAELATAVEEARERLGAHPELEPAGLDAVRRYIAGDARARLEVLDPAGLTMVRAWDEGRRLRALELLRDAERRLALRRAGPKPAAERQAYLAPSLFSTASHSPFSGS